MTVNVIKHDVELARDPSRVARYRILSEERKIFFLQRILNLDRKVLENDVDVFVEKYQKDHRERDDLKRILLDRYKLIEYLIVPELKNDLSHNQKLSIGAYFTQYDTPEGAALCNPCLISHPDQSGMAEGKLKFIMSFRAIKEGHVSSIVFRTGVIDKNGDLVFDERGRYLEAPHILNTEYDKTWFVEQALDKEIKPEFIASIFGKLGDVFTRDELREILTKIQQVLHMDSNNSENIEDFTYAVKKIESLVEANYDITFSEDSDISERVLLPVSPDEAAGIEDARFVRFTDNDGAVTYYATYTAYAHPTIQPKLIETKDFRTFKMRTLRGGAVKDKNFALFPEKIEGRYVMISRQDGENHYIMFSDDLYKWDKAHLLRSPKYSWELAQLGNCGSPIKTDHGWLLPSHGVGMGREYSISAELLSEKDLVVIATLPEPLIRGGGKAGYVPHVVYSCGSIIHGDWLIMPYAEADERCRVAKIQVADIVASMESTKPSIPVTPSLHARLDRPDFTT